MWGIVRHIYKDIYFAKELAEENEKDYHKKHRPRALRFSTDKFYNFNIKQKKHF